ncbi:pkb-activating kinase-like protein [Linnemannia hyalina]|uniref:non-specific serine/threonine protein kinase n=1 Tax=Linnemannia hyalina TaxID=64524 RepID=A0A9P7XPN1_9FUNG|nr:pkb-activating kinase-like protein [Linnemannia hyalina]
MDATSPSNSPAPPAPSSTPAAITAAAEDNDSNTNKNNNNNNNTTHLPSPQAVATTTTSAPLNGADADTPTATALSAVPVRKRTLADYRLGRTLGEGSYSTVVAAVDLSNRRDYAIKVLDKRHIIREKKVKYVNIEKNTLYKLDHPGVVKLYSTFQDSSSLYYVLELCQNGELLTYIKKLGSFDESCTRFYVAQILTAVEYVHSQGVIHRDLKPENILLDHRMYVKLTDFGTAKMLEPSEDGTESDRANSFVGTAEYVSPELLTEKAACKSSDLWALGCIIYQLLAGRPPFKGSNEYQTFQKIVRLEYTFPAGFPKAAMDLVSRLLVHDPNERLGANNTIDQLKQHPFFDGVEWSELWNQPAPKLMPYLPPTPTHNTEALRSDHDACLWSMNRTGETLMVVDPFRELGDSGSSVNNSGRNSINGHGGHETDESDGAHIVNVGVHGPSESAEATPASQSLTILPTSDDSATTTHPSPSTLPSTAKTVGGESLTPNGGTGPSQSTSLPAPGTALPKSTSAPVAVGSSTSNGHAKTKGGSRNAFVALFSGSRHSSGKKLLSKKAKAGDETAETSQQRLQARQNQMERLVGGVRREGNPRKSGGISRENSSVSLAVTANEMSAYSRRSQLELQAELSPWQSFLLPTELVLHQTPILKRKGLFSRSCILVLTDFPRLLYFDDSNHYFSQLFNSNTNDAFSSWQQQQMLPQWDPSDPLHAHQQEPGARMSLSKKPSLRQAVGKMSLDLPPPPPTSQDLQTHHQHQDHLNAVHQPLHPHPNPHPRRNTGGLDGITSGGGFLLTRNGSHAHRGGAQHRSEHTSPLAVEGVLSEEDEQGGVVDPPQGLFGRSPRASLEDQAQQHQDQHQHSPAHAHSRLQTPLPGHGQNKIDAEKRISGSGLEDEHRGDDSGMNNGTAYNNSNNGSSVTMSSSGGGSGSGGTTTILQGNKVSSSTTTLSRMGMIKASKKQAKLRGEILFTASVVSELKGKKCFFIHTTKKSYYFEESNQEGDAKTWVRILERSMEGWFGEGGGGGGDSDKGGVEVAE